MNNNKIYFISATLFVMIWLAGCEITPEVYNSKEDRLNFVYNTASDTLRSFSFVYANDNVTTDTVWLDVRAAGFLSSSDRAIAFEQVPTGTNDALAGVHYKAFTEPELQSYYRIKANMFETSIPIVVLRDASLKTSEVNLLVRIKANDYFEIGYLSRSKVRIIISDQLPRPGNWSRVQTYLLAYGPVKHKFMIDISGNKWDDEYIDEIAVDVGYLSYLKRFFTEQLAIYNATHGILIEADGTPVSF